MKSSKYRTWMDSNPLHPVALVPRQDPEGLGRPLLAFGIVDVLRTLRVAREVTTTSQRLPLVSGIGLILVAASLLAGTTAYQIT